MVTTFELGKRLEKIYMPTLVICMGAPSWHHSLTSGNIDCKPGRSGATYALDILCYVIWLFHHPVSLCLGWVVPYRGNLLHLQYSDGCHCIKGCHMLCSMRWFLLAPGRDRGYYNGIFSSGGLWDHIYGHLLHQESHLSCNYSLPDTDLSGYSCNGPLEYFHGKWSLIWVTEQYGYHPSNGSGIDPAWLYGIL